VPDDNDDQDAVFGDVIFRYTRKQAIEDGVLVDITEAAKDAGIKYPVAITSTAFFGYVALDPMPPGQDLKGRLWDLIWMFSVAMRRTSGSEVHFQILFVMPDSPEPREVTLKAICGPGDDPTPVLTIMRMDED
jgi:hypothetical protein